MKWQTQRRAHSLDCHFFVSILIEYINIAKMKLATEETVEVVAVETKPEEEEVSIYAQTRS